MSALPRPDLPPGPHRDLVTALHDLHHRAGWPSLRTLARQAGVSHTTVSKVFSAPARPSWGTVELLVEAMGGDVADFHALWLHASTPEERPRSSTPRIAGRRAELAAVRHHLEAGTGLLLVTGEAGIGKTALVEAATSAVTSVVVTGHCFPLSAATPLMPLVSVLRALHEIDGGRSFTAALGEAPAYVAGEVARLLPEMGGAATLDGPAEWARQRLFGALQSLLEAWATLDPGGVVLEDLHWADTGTLDLLEHLTRRPGSPPVAATWRLDDPATPRINDEWFSRLRVTPGVVEMTLAPLTREETVEQLALKAPSMDADAVFARSRGHPLFTVQLAAQGSGSALPTVLADLLDTRLGDLDGPLWHVARALGVADRPVELDVLSASAGLDRETTEASLRTLARRHLLDRHTGESAALGHPLLAEAVRRRLLPGEGPDQHRALADALGRGPDPAPSEVATHWQAAGDVAREVEWRMAAAQAAAGHYDRAQEAEQWLRVLEIWESRQPLPEALLVRHETAYLAAMDALVASLQFDRAADLSDAAESVLGTIDDSTRAELLRRAAIYRGQRVGADVGRALLDQALALYDRLPVCEGLVWARDWKQVLMQDLGDFEGAYLMTRAAVEAAAAVGDPSLERWCMGRLAWHVGVREGVESAQRVLDQAAAEVRVPDPLGDIRRSVIETDVMLICGSSADDVLAVGVEALGVAQELGIDSFDVLLLRFNTVCSLLREGRVAQASGLVPEDDTRTVDLDRWPVSFLGAVLDGLRGDVGSAAERIDRLFHDMGDNWVRDLEIIVVSELVDAWRPAPERNPDRLLTALAGLVGSSTPIRLVAPALVAAARAAADVTASPPEAAARHERLRDLQRRSGLIDAAHRDDPYLTAHAVTWAAEVGRLSVMATAEDWTRAATAWDRLLRRHDAAYCRWRAAQVALCEGEGTLAARLLKRAAIDAREHVPLSEAIAATRVPA